MIAGSKALDYALTIRQVTGNAAAIPATALMAARPEVVSSLAAASGTYTSTQTTTHHATDTSLVTDKFLAQAGVLAKLSSGTIQAYIAGELSVVHRACGTRIGVRKIEVISNQTNGAPQFYPLGRVPASGADKLRAALLANTINDIDYQFQVRGVNDPENPGSWTAIGSWTTLANGASATCTTDASVSGVSPGNYHTLEFAVALRLKTAGSGPAGFLSVGAGLSYT
jgi:hypothetical protein